MDSQKQKFFLFTGAIILVIIAILLTPLDIPKLSINLLSTELNSTDNLFKDGGFAFEDTSWKIFPVNNSFTSSGTRIFPGTNIPVKLTQNITLGKNISGLRIYFDAASQNKTPIILTFSDEMGQEFHKSYTSPDGILSEDIYFSPMNNISLSILLPENTASMFKSIKATPLFEGKK